MRLIDHTHARPRLWPALDLQPRLDQRRALTHTRQPEVTALRRQSLIETTAIILNREERGAVLLRQRDGDVVRVGVPCDVVDHLLADAVEVLLDFRTQACDLWRRAEGEYEPGAGPCLLGDAS